MHYEDSDGAGVPVLFLHAGSGTSRMWVEQRAAFTAAGYRFIAHDRTPEKPAADDLQALVDELGLERFHIVGTAAGGIAALDFALSFQQKLASLVIANSYFGFQDEDYLALMQRLRPSPAFDALPAEVRELGPSYRATNLAGVRRWTELHVPTRRLATRNRITLGSLDAIAVPTLLITGDADLYMPSALLRTIAPKFRNAQMRIIQECGHSAFWEQPTVFNRTVLEFIASIP